MLGPIYRSGGAAASFPLTNPVANASTAGQIRLSNNESIGWRNAANTANRLLTVDTGNILSYTGATAGNESVIAARHSDNTNAASNARFMALVGGGSGGDPYLDLQVSGVTQWTAGIDNSDTDAFTISNGAPGTNNRLKLTVAGVAIFPDGAAATPSVVGTTAVTTGFRFASGIIGASVGAVDYWNWTGAAGITLLNSSNYSYPFSYSGSVQGVKFNASGGGSSYFEHASNNKGWAFFTLDAAGYSNKWRFNRIDGNYFGGWFGELGQVYWGGNTVGQKGVSVTLEGQPNITNVGGTTTANASTTITGSSTSFLERIGIGDKISLSSASSTYATVTAIASATSLTVDAALGNGTSQTINVKRGVLRVDKAAGAATYASIDADGKITLGEPSTTETHRLNTATGTPNADALTLLNGPTGLAGNPAVYIKININGTDRYIPAW